MNKTHAAALAALFLGLGGTAALAQTGAMQSPMAKGGDGHSKADMKVAEACQKMSAEAQAKSAKCQKVAKTHPAALDSMPAGAMSTGAMSTGATSTGAMSSGQMAKPGR